VLTFHVTALCTFEVAVSLTVLIGYRKNYFIHAKTGSTGQRGDFEIQLNKVEMLNENIIEEVV
jgi:hypothetical protein